MFGINVWASLCFEFHVSIDSVRDKACKIKGVCCNAHKKK